IRRARRRARIPDAHYSVGAFTRAPRAPRMARHGAHWRSEGVALELLRRLRGVGLSSSGRVQPSHTKTNRNEGDIAMRTLRLASLVAAAVATAAAAGLALWSDQTQAQKVKPRVTRYEVDGNWPKPFPSTPDPVTGRPRTWIPGEVAGTCVDSQDNVYIVTRGNLIAPEDVKGVAAPPVMGFDPAGNTIAGWGDRNVLPNGIHGCFIDYQDNIWIAGNGDGIVQKYSKTGNLLLQIGTRGVCDNPPGNACGNSGANASANQSHTLLNQPADMYVDPNPDPITGQRGSIY